MNLKKKSYVDHISGVCEVSDYDGWKELLYQKTGKEFGYKVGDVTKKRLYNVDSEKSLVEWDSFEHNGWNLTRINYGNKDTGEIKCRIRIKGCPAKIYNNGENLYNINHFDFIEILKDFESTFSIRLNEIKVAAPTEASGTFCFHNEIKERPIIHQLRKPYEPIFNSDNELMGYQADNAHDYIKTYLPDIKFRRPLNKIRIERHFKKIPNFRRETGIETWCDLLGKEAMHECYKIVLASWQQTIIYDPTIKPKRSNKSYLNDIIRYGYNPEFWLNTFSKNISSYIAKKRIDEYNVLSFIHGEGIYQRVLNSIIEEGKQFDFVSVLMNGNNLKSINGNNRILINQDSNKDDTEKGRTDAHSKRCLSCGRDISSQSIKSKFCSAKYYGQKQAKKCRNQDSNKRNNLKRKKKNNVPVQGTQVHEITMQDRRAKLQELLARINKIA